HVFLRDAAAGADVPGQRCLVLRDRQHPQAAVLSEPGPVQPRHLRDGCDADPGGAARGTRRREGRQAILPGRVREGGPDPDGRLGPGPAGRLIAAAQLVTTQNPLNAFWYTREARM